MKVVLLLAGKGTRFLPVTETIPKPLIPVAGMPVMAHILASLRQLAIAELIVVAGYLSNQIETYLRANYGGRFRIVKQDQLDGTGGAVHAARDHIDCPVLVVFGDTIFDANLANLQDGRNVIWTRTVEDFERFGIVQTDAHGYMREIVEKPPHDVGRQANIGLYYIADHQALRDSLGRVMAAAPIKGEYYFTYALNDMVRNGRTIEVVDVDGWHDCGNLTALIATNRHLLMEGRATAGASPSGVEIIHPVLIGDGVHLQDCRIGPNVTIDGGCRIVSSIVSDTIIGRNCRLENMLVSGSLIGEGENLSGQKRHGCIIANGKAAKAT